MNSSTSVIEASIHAPLLDPELSAADVSHDYDDNYDPDQSPPDLALAAKHGKAAMIGRPMAPGKIYKRDELCPCCKQLINKEKLSLWCHPKEFSHLGASFPMFFQFIKFEILLLLISFGTSGVYGLVTNFLGNYCQTDLNFTSDFICKSSLMNKLDSLDALKQQSSANFLALMLMLIAIEYFRRSQRIIARDCQAKVPIPSQYSLMITNLPKDCTKEDIEQFLQEKKPFDEDIQIHYIYMVSNIETYAKNLEKKQKLMELNRNSAGKTDIDELANVEREIKAFQEAFKKGERPNFAGKALIVFEKMDQAKKFRIHFRLNFLQKVFMKFQPSARWPPRWAKMDRWLYQGRFIRIRKAAAPSDILWVDLGASSKERFRYRVTTYVVMTIILLTVLWILVLFKKLFKQIQQDTSEYPVISTSLSLGASGVIALTNCVVGVVLRIFVRRQKHSTKTGFYTFVGKYLSALYFCNIAVITFLANFIQAIGKPKAGQLSLSGLLYDIYFIFLTNAFFSNVFTFLDVWYGLVLWRRAKLNKKDEFFYKTTQAQANAIYENQPCDLGVRYANVCKTLLVGGAYGVFVPMGFVLSALGLTLSYWVEKSLLLTRWISPFKISRNLGKNMVGMLERYVVVFAIGNVILYILPVYAGAEKYVTKYFLTFPFFLTLLSLFVSIVYHVVLPNWRINKVIFNVRDHMSPLTYTQAKEKFEETYEMLNPLTREEALQQYTKGKITDSSIIKHRKSTVKGRMFGSVSDLRFTG